MNHDIKICAMGVTMKSLDDGPLLDRTNWGVFGMDRQNVFSLKKQGEA